MPTIKELFQNKELLFPGGSTAEGAVKKEDETLIEQETSGIRVKSAVELNNPLIYGNEATRIVNKTTSLVEDMKGDTKGEQGGGGLIGKGLSKLTGGAVDSISDLRDKVNGGLGIPANQIPSRVVTSLKTKIAAGKHNSTEPVLPGDDDKEFGKFLKSTGGGSPTTLGKQALGKGIGVAKDKLRGALFGGPNEIGETTNTDYEVNFTSNAKDSTYTDVKKSKRLLSDDNVKKDLEGTQLDLTAVSPIYGIKRNEKGKRFKNEGQYVLGNNRYSPENKETTYTGVDPTLSRDENGHPQKSTSDVKKLPMKGIYGLTNGDEINRISPTEEYTMEDDAFIKVGSDVYRDFIPVWFKRLGADKPLVFRAIISGITESTSPSWSGNKFIGNPYQFYMYDGVERSVSFNIKLFAASPIELGGIWERLKMLTSYTYPTISKGLTVPPIIDFRLGDIYSNRKAFVDSLTYTIPDESNWETNGELGYLPKMVDVAISLKFIETAGDEQRLYDMTISEAAVDAINKKNTDDKAAIDEQTKTQGGTVKKDGGSVPKMTKKKQSSINILKGKSKNKLKELKGKTNIFGKAKTPKPSDTEEGIPDTTTQQSATADKLDGQTPHEAEKKLQSGGMTPEQSKAVTGLLAIGAKEVDKSEIPTDQIFMIQPDTGKSKFFKRVQYGKFDIWQARSNRSIPNRVAGGYE